MGVDPSIPCHSLNVRADAKPVVQRARRSSVQHADAVLKELKKLQEAGAVEEVKFPTWVANPVVVEKKKTGGWRVCGGEVARPIPVAVVIPVRRRRAQRF